MDSFKKVATCFNGCNENELCLEHRVKEIAEKSQSKMCSIFDEELICQTIYKESNNIKLFRRTFLIIHILNTKDHLSGVRLFIGCKHTKKSEYSRLYPKDKVTPEQSRIIESFKSVAQEFNLSIIEQNTMSTFGVCAFNKEKTKTIDIFIRAELSFSKSDKKIFRSTERA